MRATAAESALVGAAAEPGADALKEIGELAVADLEPPEDIHASSRYRRSVGAYVVQRALSTALEAARG